jgi:hypothetical protein
MTTYEYHRRHFADLIGFPTGAYGCSRPFYQRLRIVSAHGSAERLQLFLNLWDASDLISISRSLFSYMYGSEVPE